MRIICLILALLVSDTANAKIYECKQGGKTSFQKSPCGPESSVAKTMEENDPRAANLPWQGLKYGMFVEAVQRKIPGALPATSDHLFGGAVKRLSLQGVKLADMIWEASYFFDGDKFVQVNLSDSGMNENKINLGYFDKLSAEFRERYGKESSQNMKNESWGVSGKAEWLTGDGEVWITIAPVTAATSLLTFGYKPNKN